MKNRIVHKLFALLLVLLFVVGYGAPVGTAMAEGEEITSDYLEAAGILEENLNATGMQLNAEQRLYDFCGKFGTEEQEEISVWIAEREEECGASIRVFVAEMDMDDEKYFLEECADALCDNKYAKEDLAILLLNLAPYNRGVCIQGYGVCEIRLNDDRIEYILDDIIEWFSKDDYVYGVKLFAEEAAYYVKTSDSLHATDYGDTTGYVDTTIYKPYYKDNSFKGKVHRMPWPALVIAPLGVAVIGILLMKYNGGSRMTVNGRTYLDNATSGLTAKRDDYVRTGVSKTYSPRTSSTSGGSSGGRSSGGGGRSSGGRSHSGGSRRF